MPCLNFSLAFDPVSSSEDLGFPDKCRPGPSDAHLILAKADLQLLHMKPGEELIKSGKTPRCFSSWRKRKSGLAVTLRLA